MFALIALGSRTIHGDETTLLEGGFEKQAAPVFIRNCVSCHNASDPKGMLDLTQAKSAIDGGESGPAIVRGEPEKSLLIERVTDGSMPPAGKGKRLSLPEVAALRAWIKAGADWPAERVLNPFELTTAERAGYDWWSLQPLRRPELPIVRNRDWVRTPIDTFIAQKLERENLEPAPEADRVTYIRRVTFDLIGLPPTPAEIDAFVEDPNPNAYETLIDRLLASPHYGERWGRHWLDVVRFGESDGFENDKLRSEAWPYRDYVIRSLNDDKPYRQFVREQLAGDVLPPVTHDGIAGSGFLVAGPWDEVQNVGRSPTEKLRAREEQLEELVAAVGQAFLGVTVQCSRCHDHKFDPIAQIDYYRIKAVFEGVEHGNRPLLTPEEQQAHDAQVKPIAERVDALRKEIESLKAKKEGETERGGEGENEKRVAASKEELKLRESELSANAPPLVYAGVRKEPPPTVLYLRGDIRKPEMPVIPGALSAVRTQSSELGLTAETPEAKRRIRFAEWVVDPDNPLTPRVLVNRVWHYHFGQGLVEMPSDFGFNGGHPSHPELLDWLAAEFMNPSAVPPPLRKGGEPRIEDRGSKIEEDVSGTRSSILDPPSPASHAWTLKRLHKLILLSAVYRQSSQFNSKAAAVDSDNRWLWRFAPRRLEAETIRDAMLAVSGELNRQVGGPSFRPFTVTAILTQFYHLIDDGRPEFNRRTVYRINVNTAKSPFLDALDCPAPSLAAPKRRSTTTTLQALALMNDPFVERQGAKLAGRIEAAKRESPAEIDEVHLAYRIALGREPSADELAATRRLVSEHGLASACWALLNSSEFLYSK
jgi:Protein of unknown function (DUF1549)/Protein of unknown function (DUF1553)/Planctomycete cytochrome C